MMKIVYVFATFVGVFAMHGMKVTETAYFKNLENALEHGRKEEVRNFLNELPAKDASQHVRATAEQSMRIGVSLDRDEVLRQALMQAIKHGKWDIVHMIVQDFDAGIHGKKGRPMTPLQFALSLKKDESVHPESLDRDYIIGYLRREGAEE